MARCYRTETEDRAVVPLFVDCIGDRGYRVPGCVCQHFIAATNHQFLAIAVGGEVRRKYAIRKLPVPKSEFWEIWSHRE
jgi:hypothetical protein